MKQLISTFHEKVGEMEDAYMAARHSEVMDVFKESMQRVIKFTKLVIIRLL